MRTVIYGIYSRGVYCRLLLQYKAVPDQQDVNGRTALHCVCELTEPEQPELISAHVQV